MPSASAQEPTSVPSLVAIVDANRARAAILEEGLREAGVARVVTIPETPGLMQRLVELGPDVVIIDLESPSRDMVEQMCAVSRALARPVAMFVDGADAAAMRSAIEAGVSAYVADGLARERVRPIVEEAILRFSAFARMQRELDAARNQLAERKLIDRAKGILMRLRGVGEEEAYALMRSSAMNGNRRIADIAQSIITTAELLP